jgi:hypothetical protein
VCHQLVYCSPLTPNPEQPHSLPQLSNVPQYPHLFSILILVTVSLSCPAYSSWNSKSESCVPKPRSSNPAAGCYKPLGLLHVDMKSHFQPEYGPFAHWGCAFFFSLACTRKVENLHRASNNNDTQLCPLTAVVRLISLTYFCSAPLRGFQPLLTRSSCTLRWPAVVPPLRSANLLSCEKGIRGASTPE